MLVGRTPWSAADALVGYQSLHEPDFVGETAGPGGPARTRGSALGSALPAGGELSCLKVLFICWLLSVQFHCPLEATQGAFRIALRQSHFA